MRMILRIAGVVGLVAMAWIHIHLYRIGYSTVPTIGPLFLLNGVLGAVAAVAVLVTPGRWLPWVAAAAALLDAGTLAALLLSLTVGLFGFHESTTAPLFWTTVVVELAGTAVLVVLALPLLDTMLERVRSRDTALRLRSSGSGRLGSRP